MPEIEVSLTEDKKMAADISEERTDLILSESLQNHSSLMHGTRANEQSAHNIARHSSVRQFDQVGPVEAAAVEVIIGRLG